jgi:hypothetical protein
VIVTLTNAKGEQVCWHQSPMNTLLGDDDYIDSLSQGQNETEQDVYANSCPVSDSHLRSRGELNSSQISGQLNGMPPCRGLASGMI